MTEYKTDLNFPIIPESFSPEERRFFLEFFRVISDLFVEQTVFKSNVHIEGNLDVAGNINVGGSVSEAGGTSTGGDHE